jgi:putative transposase
MVRGIDRTSIFRDTKDRQDFLDRLGKIGEETGTRIYAWALIPNHFHLLLRSGPAGLSTFMGRLLTGYAITFNLRHKRRGHLFQNRYKSIVCEEDPYFIELVRYIHLNPLRAHLVETVDRLDSYPWSGHTVLLGKSRVPWQDCDYVLLWFGKRERSAKEAYRKFVERGALQGRRPALTGGGLTRSLGGMEKVVRLKGRDRPLTDERILGTGEFVRQLIEKADRLRNPHLSLPQRIERMAQTIAARCRHEGISLEALTAGSKAGSIPKVRSDLARQVFDELGLSYAEIGRALGVSTSGVSRMMAKRSKSR